MIFREKVKTIDNKIVQSKAEYDLDRETAKISALLSGNVNKYEFLTGGDILPEKAFLEKAATKIATKGCYKRSEYSSLGKKLKA